MIRQARLFCGYMEKIIVVEIIQDEKPISSLCIIEPITEELEDIDLGVLPASYLGAVGDFSATLLKASCIARINPENPRVGRSI